MGFRRRSSPAPARCRPLWRATTRSSSRAASLFGARIEEATLAKRLLTLGEDPALLSHLRERADWLEGHAARVCDWLGTPPLDGCT